MKTLLDWLNQKTNNNEISKLFLILVLITLFGFSPLSEGESHIMIAKIMTDSTYVAESTIVGKSLSINRNSDGEPYIRIGNVGADSPCGRAFAISIEGERYFFSKMSSMNATLMSNIITLPPSLTMDSIVNKISSLKVGISKNENRFGISEDDIEKHYKAPYIFPIDVNGQARLAFNSEILIYETLITIQFLLEENAKMQQLLNQLNNKKE